MYVSSPAEAGQYHYIDELIDDLDLHDEYEQVFDAPLREHERATSENRAIELVLEEADATYSLLEVGNNPLIYVVLEMETQQIDDDVLLLNGLTAQQLGLVTEAAEREISAMDELNMDIDEFVSANQATVEATDTL